MKLALFLFCWRRDGVEAVIYEVKLVFSIDVLDWCSSFEWKKGVAEC